MPRRAADPVHELRAQLAALEERVARLEQGRPPPGDGRTTRVRSATGKAPVPRCAGCGLRLRRRNGRCAECGRPLDV